MGVSDWNFRWPTDLQDYSWDCAAASTAWALQSIGLAYSEADVIRGFGPERISPALGLLDASGAGIVSYLAEVGVAAQNVAVASFDDLEAAAGFQPMVCGGRRWNHWTGVRMGGYAFDGTQHGTILLANPAPGWMGVDQSMSAAQAEQLGPFSAVWFTSW